MCMKHKAEYLVSYNFSFIIGYAVSDTTESKSDMDTFHVAVLALAYYTFVDGDRSIRLSLAPAGCGQRGKPVCTMQTWVYIHIH